jgi:hypothetical protein
MKVNITETGEEVATSFDDDAAALMGRDGSALDRLFWTSTQVIRFGAAHKLSAAHKSLNSPELLPAGSVAKVILGRAHRIGATSPPPLCP